MPSRFTPITRCQSSTVVCSISAAWPMPALLWSTSTRPSSSNTREANASTASGSVTSTTCAFALPPISRVTASADSPFTSATCTFAPSFANSSALARPIPEPAPVTTTTLPANPGASMRPYASAVAPEPFTIDVADEVLDDLRERIRSMRWPDQIPGIGWNQGTELDYLRRTLDHWADGFDWRGQEREVNSFAHFRAEIDGAGVHFVHERARDGRAGIPLLLQHGWPSSFVEYLGLVPLLTDPRAHGIDGPSFDLVIPSLPGYGFSERPAQTGVNYRHTAARWHRLMQMLGYERYAVGGGDFGAGVATYMALDDPERVIGLHLTNFEIAPYTGPGSEPPTDAAQAYIDERRAWEEVERGYGAIQSTKPQTLGYALNDSPAGLAAWILEKWRSWTDSGGDLEQSFERDFLLTTVTLYWVTQTITSSLRDYYDNRFSGDPIGPDDRVRVPTAFGVFPNHFVAEGEPPREWMEGLYDVRRRTGRRAAATSRRSSSPSSWRATSRLSSARSNRAGTASC